MDIQKLHVIQHPVIEHYLMIMRSKKTDSETFRRTMKKLTALVSYPLSEFLETMSVDVETPLGFAKGVALKKEIAIFPILRSGILFSDTIADLLPISFIGLLGIRRNRDSLLPEIYYSNIPDDIGHYTCVILDPMLATGRIICKSIEILKACNAKEFIVLSLVATQDGIDNILSQYPDIDIMVLPVLWWSNSHIQPTQMEQYSSSKSVFISESACHSFYVLNDTIL